MFLNNRKFENDRFIKELIIRVSKFESRIGNEFDKYNIYKAGH